MGLRSLFALWLQATGAMRSSAGRLLCRASVAESSAHRLYASSEQPTLHSSSGRNHASVAARRRFEPEGHPRRVRNLLPIPWAAPLLRFGPLQRHQQEESFWRHDRRKRLSCRLQLCLGRNLAVFRVSHSLDGLLLFRPCQLVSSDKHSWGLDGPLPHSAAAVQPMTGCVAVDACSDKPSRGTHTEGRDKIQSNLRCFHPA